MAIRIYVHAVPKARSTELAGRRGDAWKVKVAAPPEDGRANGALVEHLAEVLGVPRGAVRLVRGAASRAKVFEVDDIGGEEAHARLSRAVSSKA